MTKLKRKIETFRSKCREAGLRITPQRMEVYRALLQTDEHPSADMVFRKVRKVLPNVSLDTVNRTLLTSSEIGAAFVVGGPGDVKRYDGNSESHQYLKYIKCKRIVDFYHKPFDNVSVPKNLGRKFTVLKRTVYLEGICDLCRQNALN